MKKLFDFQKKALKSIESYSHCLLALDMGLGKTIVALHWVLTKKPTNWLCLVPKNKVNDWFLESIEELSQIYGIIKVGSSKDFLKWKESFNKNKTYFVIMSFDVFTNLNKKTPYFWSFADNWSLIFDESQALKTHNSKRTIGVLKLYEDLTNVILLSGDPISKRYENLYAQMILINSLSKTVKYEQFVDTYCNYFYLNNTRVKIITSYKNLDSLLDKLHANSYFLKTQDAFDLPQKHFIDVKVKQSKEYQEMKINDGLTLNDEIIIADSSFKKLSALRQICSGFIYDNNKTFKLPNPKQEVLSELLESDNNFLIFYNFNAELETILEVCKKHNKNVYILNGKNDDRNTKYEETNSVFVTQYLSGAAGIDGLQKYFNYVIYYSPTLSGELYKQSIKRIHRIGQVNKCIYYRLVMENSIENRIYKSLFKSEDYTLKIFEIEKE